ncbi:G-type lectin S-receptor-like serine/threonine-protein kinase LECRK4 [Aegilops tauschii subsp. strangulata]
MTPLGTSPSSGLHLAPLLIVLLMHQPHLLVVVADNLTAGSSLRPPQYITCPSGDFAFGFRALDYDPSHFLLAVWFNLNLDPAADPGQKKVVWYAKDPASDSAIMATGQAVFSITPHGELLLTDSTTGGNIWTNPSPGQSGNVLRLQDSGNLQFVAIGGSNVVWETFRHPTDTLLPGQTMVSGAKLQSKRSDTDFSRGRFSMYVQADGNIVLYLMNLAGDNMDSYNSYWRTGTDQPGQTQDGNTTLFFDSPGHLHYQIKDGTMHDLAPPMPNSNVSYFQHATLDPDGIVRVYTLQKNATGRRNVPWTIFGLFPSNGCSSSTTGWEGMCGPNSYCVYGPNNKLDCECPSGYSFIDPRLKYRGCTPAFVPQSCDGKNQPSEFSLVKLPNTTWLLSSYRGYSYTTEEQCDNSCLRDCFCTATLFDGKVCYKMALLAGAGWQEGSLNMKSSIKVRTSSLPMPTSPRRPLPYLLLICSVLLMLAAASSLMLHCCLRKRNTNHDFLRVFTGKELYKATNGFHKLLGKGGFGEVYHGVIMSPHTSDVAVKKLINSNEYSEREFANEVQSIGRIHHRNLVRMVGYCKEREQRMLVFEFMPGGSLRSFLFQPQRPLWTWRVEAAIGIAKGLEYLHEGCDYPIIHCDIKPDNILLDGKSNPKITDFGIAELLNNQQMHTTVTNIRGTRGYIAPEWFQNDRRIDTKVDVYSFGVVLLEMICCRKCQDPVTGQDGDDSVTLFWWAGQLVCHGRIEVLLHSDDDAMEDLVRVERFSRVAFWCIEPNPLLRPTMHQVVQMLEGVVEVGVLPDPPSSTDSPPLISSVDWSALLSSDTPLTPLQVE